jgi:hypothetical protein
MNASTLIESPEKASAKPTAIPIAFPVKSSKAKKITSKVTPTNRITKPGKDRRKFLKNTDKEGSMQSLQTISALSGVGSSTATLDKPNSP